MLRHGFDWLQHCLNVAMLCFAKNRRWESSHVSLHVTSRVGDQEQKHFSPLGTKRPFHVNSTKKDVYCIDHQHGRYKTAKKCTKECGERAKY